MAGRKKSAKTARRKTYHHGNLREALVDAAERILEESGPESVTVREAARRAGVSPGAPFRHFSSRRALMTAVAERAMRRFLDEIDRSLAAADPDDPLARLLALGSAYVRWVTRNPKQFRVVATRDQIDFEGSESLTGDNDRIRALMKEIVVEGQSRGRIRAGDPVQIELTARALSYGLARMFVDGHFAQWDVPARNAPGAMRAVLEFFSATLARAPGARP